MATLTNAQVRKALRASKKKWKDIEAGKIADEGGDNCALCQMFFLCTGCPIAEHTGLVDCSLSPYREYVEHTPNGELATTPEAKAAAHEMVKFLEMLDRKYFVEGVTVK